MNKKLMTLLAVSALSTLTACGSSDGDSTPSRASLCTPGLSAECLEGTWTVNGVRQISTATMFSEYDYTAMPGSIEFKNGKAVNESTEGEFVYTCPSAVTALDPDCSSFKGTWTLTGTSLKLYSNALFLSVNTKVLAPTVTSIDGVNFELNLNGHFFLTNVMGDNATLQQDATEIFTIK